MLVERIKQLTNLQMAVMKVLWQQGEATVAQVHARLREEHGLAPTTVATLLSRLEKYGVLTHRSEGRQYVYRPLVSRGQVRRSRLAELVDQFFRGNPAELAYHLLDQSEVGEEDLERIRALIEAKERQDDDDR
jgi:predicted transcriptional regulator